MYPNFFPSWGGGALGSMVADCHTHSGMPWKFALSIVFLFYPHPINGSTEAQTKLDSVSFLIGSVLVDTPSCVDTPVDGFTFSRIHVPTFSLENVVLGELTHCPSPL